MTFFGTQDQWEEMVLEFTGTEPCLDCEHKGPRRSIDDCVRCMNEELKNRR